MMDSNKAVFAGEGTPSRGARRRRGAVVLLPVLLAVTVGLACAHCCHDRAAPGKPMRSGEAGAVLAVFLQGWMTTRSLGPDHHGGRPGLVVVRDPLPGPKFMPTQGPATEEELQWVWEDLHREWPQLERSTWDSLAALDAARGDLGLLLPPSARTGILLLSSAEVDRVLREHLDGWAEVRRRWPGVEEVLEVTLPGFSRSGRQALLYAERVAGYEDGDGVFVLLAKEGGQWVVVGTLHTWVS